MGTSSLHKPPSSRSFYIFLLICVCTVAIFLDCFAQDENLLDTQKSIMARHTFQSPFLFGVSSSIPYWNYGGSAVATENFVRLVPAIRSRVGWIWNTEPVLATDWEVTIEFNIHNTHSPGADGMAFWYAKEPSKTGPLVGYTEDFDGIGIIFDTYDNNGNGDNPSVVAVKGNGQHIAWDYENDFQANQLDRCRADFRNPVTGNTKAKITYNRGYLSVYIDSHGTGQYSYCLSVNDLRLKPGYYFGLTAATGGLADYHDVYNFVTVDLNPKEEKVEKKKKKKGKKGWYDPYQQQQQEEEEEEEVELQQNQEKDQEDTNNAEEDDFFANLKEKLKKYGIDDTDAASKNKEEKPNETSKRNIRERQQEVQSNNNNNDQDPTNQQNQRNRRKSPIVKKQQEEEKQEKQEQQREETPIPSSYDNQRSESESRSDETYIQNVQTIASALKTIAQLVRNSASKADLSLLLDRVADVAKKQIIVQNDLIDVRDHIKTEVNSMMGDLKKETASLSDEIKRLDSMLNTLYIQVDNIHNQQGAFARNFEKSSDEVKETIKKESSLGFWTFFILFQIVFTGLIIYWKKYRDQEKSNRYIL